MSGLLKLRKQQITVLIVIVFCVFGILTQFKPGLTSNTADFLKKVSTSEENDQNENKNDSKWFGLLSKFYSQKENYESESDHEEIAIGLNEIDVQSVDKKERDNNEDNQVSEEFQHDLKQVWTYKCNPERGCIRTELMENETSVGPQVCWLTCGDYGGLWPFPTNKVKIDNCTLPFDKDAIILQQRDSPNEQTKIILDEMWKVFLGRVKKMTKTAQSEDKKTEKSLNTVAVQIIVSDGDISIASLDVDESYSLTIIGSNKDCEIKESGTKLQATINAKTIFGARHALETLSQLMTYDSINKCLQIVSGVEIIDGPAFPLRGILIDTARNFIPIPDLKRMIDGMAINKLNTFHWHISDSNAFPFYSKQVPEMVQYGAYSLEKVYYPNDIKDLRRYALVRGVRIIPELDSPAHAGNGWQWGNFKGLGDLALCVNAEPWRSFCGQPQCGQLNPVNPNTYIILEKLYEDMMEAFTDVDQSNSSLLFHMGGDEVYFQCWDNHSGVQDWKRLTNQTGMDLWGKFQEDALQRLKKASKGKLQKAIVWTSGMTSGNGRKYLNPSDYIIQVWDGRNAVHQLLKDNYQLIMSNVDSMYLDQGAGTWLGRDHIYTYAYWQKLYDNSLETFFRNISQDRERMPSQRQILGGEATLWSEKVNSENMDVKTWPRGSALAENLWSDPRQRTPIVYSRLNHHTRRMIQMGIHSDQLQPESCYQISGHCDDPQSRI